MQKHDYVPCSMWDKKLMKTIYLKIYRSTLAGAKKAQQPIQNSDC